jgi:hypothetical protein
MIRYICNIKECDASYHPEEGCNFNEKNTDHIRSRRNDNCIYRASYVKKHLEELK